MAATMEPIERLSTLTATQRELQGTADLMRLLSCKTITRGSDAPAMDLFLERWPNAMHAPIVRRTVTDYRTKAAVAPGNTTDATWAAPLANPAALVDPFLALVQKESALGRIVGVRKVPFDTPVPLLTDAGSYAWTGQNTPKPVTKLALDSARLPIGKISGIVVLTAELVRLAAPGSETVMRDFLTGGLVAFQDQQFLDPAVAAVAGVSPASITNGAAVVAPTGGDIADDVAALLATLYANRPNVQLPTLAMSPANAGALAATGAHPQVTVSGGLAFGVPVVTTPGAGLHIAAFDAAAVIYADDGLAIDISTEAAIEMSDAPTGGAGAVVVSLWQHNLAGFLVERFLWYEAAPEAVAVLTRPAPAVARATPGGAPTTTPTAMPATAPALPPGVRPRMPGR
jgi:hypothetical protein